MSTPELRKRWRQYCIECERIMKENNRRRESHHRSFLRAYALGLSFTTVVVN